jgi:hypothetical protein
MQCNPRYPRHIYTQVCLLGAEQRTQQDSAISAALALCKLFHVEGEVLEKVDLFQYLGRVLAQDNDDIRPVRQQIKKARGIWARVGQVLTADNTPPKTRAKFYKAVVQSVLLYGSKTWNLIQPLWRGLRGSTFAQFTGWQRITSQRMNQITRGYTRGPPTSYRSVAWPPYCITSTSGGPQSFNMWWTGQSTRRAREKNKGGDCHRNSGVCVSRPPVTRGVTVKRAIPIASNPPQ